MGSSAGGVGLSGCRIALGQGVGRDGSGDRTVGIADARRNNGGYVLTIPALVYQHSAQNVPGDIDVYVVGNDVAGGGRNIAIHMVPGATSNVSIYLVPAGSADTAFNA